jgi:hypothetical protein
MAIIVNGVTYQPMPVGLINAPPTVGVYYTLPPYGDPPMVGPINYDEEMIKWPGRSTTVTKRLQSFTRLITINFLVVSNSLANMTTAQVGLDNSVNQLARYTITINGTTFQGCKVVFGTGMPSREVYPNASFSLIIPYAFKQISLTN